VALNELAAVVWTKTPVALVPTNDPMTLNGDKVSVAKTNLYRVGVDQAPLANGANTGSSYCRNMVRIAPRRLNKDRRFFRNAPSPDPAAAKNLYVFLLQRLRSSFDELGCGALLHRRNPIPPRANPAALDAAVDPQQLEPAPNAPPPNAPPPPGPTPVPSPSVSQAKE
jgi:hypothetical protein